MEQTIREQERQIAKLTKANLELKEELGKVEAKFATETRVFEYKLNQLEEQQNEQRKKAERIQKQLTSVEIENENHESQNRIKEEIIRDLTYQTTVLHEKMTMLQLESEEVKNMTQEETERLREQLKETEEELLALKKRRWLTRRQNGHRRHVGEKGPETENQHREF
jgi:hypothetical protein